MEDEQVRTKYLCGNILWIFTRKPQQYLRLISSNKCKGTSHDMPLINDTTLEWVTAWGKIRFLIKMLFPYILVDSHFKTHGFHFQLHYLHLNRLLMIKLGFPKYWGDRWYLKFVLCTLSSPVSWANPKLWPISWATVT